MLYNKYCTFIYVYIQEVSSLRKTGFTVHVDGGTEDTDDDFAERLRAAIDEAREEIENETERFKMDLERTYKSKVNV